MSSNQLADSSRLRKIRIVSRIFRVLLVIAAGLMVLIGAWALLQGIIIALGGNVPAGQSMTVHLAFSPSQSYILASDTPSIPWPVVLLGTIQLGLTACGFIALNRLFLHFERGIFFTVENVGYVKVLGFVVAGYGLIQMVQELLAPHGSINFNLVVIGALILLIAWIMEEAGKLKEEQELTV